MFRRFDGKVALITGASRGIGRETAIEFAKEGASVVINYNSTIPRETIREVKKHAKEYLSVKCDVSKREEVKQMVSKAIEKFGKIDILVNNAGILLWKPFLETDEALWRKHFEINVNGTFYTTQEVLPHMLRQKYGKILIVSSIVGKQGSKSAPAYASSKAALLGLMKSLAFEFASKNITVNAIAPGHIDTELVSDVLKKYKGEIIRDYPIGRIGTAKEVARTILFLCSDEAPFITGETININGGRLRD